jgi:hypothetical protein
MRVDRILTAPASPKVVIFTASIVRDFFPTEIREENRFARH